jgi:hypothetical protein
MSKKIIVSALALFIAGFGAYRAFNDLANAIESWEMEDDEAEETE